MPLFKKKPSLLPPLNSKVPEDMKREYTLVLDMDETLIHSNPYRPSRFAIRPNCRAFLAAMSPLFEVVVFTAGTKDYADDVLNKLDSKK